MHVVFWVSITRYWNICILHDEGILESKNLIEKHLFTLLILILDKDMLIDGLNLNFLHTRVYVLGNLFFN